MIASRRYSLAVALTVVVRHGEAAPHHKKQVFNRIWYERPASARWTSTWLGWQSGPIATILAQMDPAGYWVTPGPGYNPKYRSTVWSVILLAELGASVTEDARIARACTYLMEHALTPGGQFTASGAPSGTVDCLQGNLCWALLTLGCDPARLDPAIEWMARSVTGEGVAPRTEKHAPLHTYAWQKKIRDRRPRWLLLSATTMATSQVYRPRGVDLHSGRPVCGRGTARMAMMQAVSHTAHLTTMHSYTFAWPVSAWRPGCAGRIPNNQRINGIRRTATSYTKSVAASAERLIIRYLARAGMSNGTT